MIAAPNQRLGWLSTQDGFALCPQSLSQLLSEKGIADTGISSVNKSDVESYYDDWHLYRIGSTYGLCKLREQEHNYVPGFSDRDDPSVTVSFVPFPVDVLEGLPQGCGAEAPEMAAFVSAFRDTTERFPQRHSPVLQAYFSHPSSQGSYVIGETYVKKLLALFPDGVLPFPEKHLLISPRLRKGLNAINRKAGREIVRWEDRSILVADPLAPSLLERQAILGFYTGDLSFTGFAAEVKFHADALIQWPAKLPVFGKIWYNAALRADMQFGPENTLYTLALCPYYHPDSALVREQRNLHGDI